MKDEIIELEKKERYYNEKKNLITERISLLEKSVDVNNTDYLKNNSTKLEILEWEANLEGVISYWNHYTERLKHNRINAELLTKEYEQNYKTYYDILTNIPPESIKTYSVQLQEQYMKIKSLLSKEWKEQREKNAFYALMKEILIRMKKIK